MVYFYCFSDWRGTVFKLSSLKDAFYVPMQEFMNLSNTQIGLALSVYGIVQTVGNFASIL